MCEIEPIAEDVLKYEAGQLTDEADLVEMFQYLISTGLAWKMPNHYGRLASEFLRAGVCIHPKDMEPDEEADANSDPIITGAIEVIKQIFCALAVGWT